VLNHGSFDRNGQGYILSVYDDKVTVRARVFGDGKYVDSNLPGAYFEVKID
jgi:hypothetical protein